MYALSQWIMLLVITKFQGVEAAGVYSLYLAILTPLNILTNYGLRNFISSDVNHEFSETTYLSLRYFGVLVFLSFSSFGFLFIDNKLLYLVVLSIKFFDSLSELEYGNWNRNGVIYHYAISQLVRLILFLFSLVLIYVTFDNKNYLLLVFPASILVTYIFYDVRFSSLKLQLSKFDFHKLFELAKLASPLAMGSVVVSLNVMVTRYTIDDFLGSLDLAKYVYLQYYFTVASIIVISLGQISIPVLSKNRNDPNAQWLIIRKWNFYILIYGLIFALCIIFLSNPVSMLLYSEDINYNLCQRIIVAFSGMVAFFSLYGNSILISRKKLKSIFMINLFSLVMTVLLIYIFVGNYGLTGAFLTFLMVNFTILIVVAWQVFITRKVKHE
ncbi:TPA: hypothetical protein I7162_21415 [Vibrio vulnificus]|nr:hypothetical protein [Vibrio vulnificus]